ncbi:MAG TPA: AAA family ATPase, partial [Actinomycetota bacterium]|nr:AAA family ATPase [Actinomycetota bacterium]
LRSGSMEDVIFAGSAGRPPLGMAVVELTLDNSDRALPLDLSEVTITRTTERNGNSSYRINGAPCRLLDVAELLSDTGIGKSLHALVGQGQLDAVLHARPEDRRTFIEEAAQIGKYRRRKERSLRKIERVEENLLRLGDVLSELKRAIRPVKRQAEAAAVHSELLEEHRQLKQRLAATELDRLSRERSAFDPGTEAHRADLLAEELASVRAQLQGAANERERLGEAAERQGRVANGIDRAADRLGDLSRLATERAEKIAARLAAETEEGYRERIRLLEADRDRWEAEATSLEEAASPARAAADASKTEAEEARAATRRAEEAVTAARQDETAATQALVRAESNEAAGRGTVASIAARVEAVEERRETIRRKLGEDDSALEEAERQVLAIEADLDRATEQTAEHEARLDAASNRVEELKSKLGVSHAGRVATAARLETLVEVERLFSGHPEVAARLRPLVEDARERHRLASASEDEAAEILAAAEQDVHTRRREIEALDEELRRLDALLNGAAERLAGRRRQRGNREVELAALEDELTRAEEALAAARRQAEEERDALPARRAAVEEARRVREAAEKELSEARKREAHAARVATDLEMAARSAEERVLAARLRHEEAQAGVADAERALAGLEDLRASLQVAGARAERVAEVAAAAAHRGRRWAVEAEERAAVARTAAHESDRKVGNLRSRERELAQSLEAVNRKRSETEVKRAQVDARIESVLERAMEEWGLGREELTNLDVVSEEDEHTVRARLQKLDQDMRRLGPVNPRAAQECAELSEREQFLLSQIEDLNRSKKDLMRIVKEVDETIVRVFTEAYEAVAREFEQVFERLFPGGKGSLRLVDPSDPLTSGVDIEARPPGKNIRKLSLLSGGERSLVALAFLFAIFRSRPSPFYLLDEVEAALDDINLQRFLALVEELEQRAQILIVSHQKRTMEAADVLYGVSMAKDGVSRVVAKRLHEVAV